MSSDVLRKKTYGIIRNVTTELASKKTKKYTSRNNKNNNCSINNSPSFDYNNSGNSNNNTNEMIHFQLLRNCLNVSRIIPKIIIKKAIFIITKNDKLYK